MEDLEESREVIEVYTRARDLFEIKKRIEGLGLPTNESSQVYRPMTTIAITDKGQAEKIVALMEALEEHDDVQRTYANFDIPEKML